MQDFTYWVPTKVYNGKGVVRKELGGLAAGLGKKAMILHYGDGIAEKIGALSDVTESLKEAGVDFIEFTGIKPNPVISKVDEGINICKKEGIDLLIPIGGGSVSDTAKCIAGCYHYNGPGWDVVMDPSLVKDPMPIIAVPTLAATGSDMDNSGMIHNEELHLKKSLGNPGLFPKYSIQDPTYTLNLPMKQTAAGIADIMSHISEVYFSKTEGAIFADTVMEALMRICLECGKILAKEPTNYDARANLMWTASWGCNGLFYTGKILRRWSVHPMEHELGSFYDDPHGQGIAILTPVWMRYVLNDDTVGMFVNFAKNVMGIAECDDKFAMANAGIDELERLYQSWGIPKNLRESGIGITDESKFDIMAEQAIGPTGAINGFVPLSKEDVINIYRTAL